MFLRMVCALVLAAAASLTPARLYAAPVMVTLTMGDLPTQSINGLVHPQGLTFGFTVGGVGDIDARYSAGGPGDLVFVQDPSIEGTTSGVLSIPRRSSNLASRAIGTPRFPTQPPFGSSTPRTLCWPRCH
jgi:hypothetical protein